MYKNIGIAFDKIFLKHNLQSHPENANRILSIIKELKQKKLWQHFTHIKVKEATQKELALVHSTEYINDIALASKLLQEKNDSKSYYINPYIQDTYYNAFTYSAAIRAVAATIDLNLAIYDRKFSSGFALVRPPSHHAIQNEAMGFCIFASEVIAAKILQQKKNINKIAIVDYDVHHCNGTQDLTIDDPSIISASIHQHPLWPMTGDKKHIGKGKAKYTNINVPLPVGAGDESYKFGMEKIIIPRLRKLKPEHIIIFAGFDAHFKDQLAGHKVSNRGFLDISAMLILAADEICQGRIGFSLGGGYNLKAIGESASGVIELLAIMSNKKDLKELRNQKIKLLNQKNATKKLKIINQKINVLVAKYIDKILTNHSAPPKNIGEIDYSKTLRKLQEFHDIG